MTPSPRELCVKLMLADSAEDVKQILLDERYWEKDSAWRAFSDNENNFGTIGNQQSDPVAALVEKLINSIDARLMGLAAERGITPDNEDCPKDMREAIASFVEGREAPFGETAGNIFYWTDDDIKRESKNISIFATGKKNSYPCLTISDRGEGQTPDSIPHTIMASGKSNKIRIPYVQGKFNMGGTGVFQFCCDEGKHQIQLVISRRNPKLLPPGASSRDYEWGFTILRRVSREGMKSSMYEYLAPLDKHSILSFSATEFPIFPSDEKERPVAYKKNSQFGTLIKLFEYNCKQARTNITFKGSKGDSLKVQIEEMLPEAALPIQIAECRSYGGRDRRSLEDEILGAVTQLGNWENETKEERLETTSPVTGLVSLTGTGLPIKIFVFKEDLEKKRYNPSGIFFVVNGQTHAHEPSRFFNKANLSYIKDSLLVMVDCSAMSNLDRENIFMNSRDRMRGGHDSQILKESIEKFLKDESLLQELNRKRQQERIRRSLEDQKPLEETLKRLVKENPQLANLLPFGIKIPTNIPGAGTDTVSAREFQGKQTPTFFRFKGNKTELHREIPINQNSRITFETDALDDYFSRKSVPGVLQIHVQDPLGNQIMTNYRIGNLHNGLLTIVFEFDPKNHEIGECLIIQFTVKDESLLNPFRTLLELKLLEQADSRSSGTEGKDKVANQGKGDSGGAKSAGLPNIVPITQEEWEVEGFTDISAVKVKSNPEVGYDFYYNKDNKHLKYAQSSMKIEPNILDHQYKIGLTLFSLAIIEAAKIPDEGEDSRILKDGDIESAVSEITDALSPYWLPIFQALTGLKFDQIESQD